ncbi:hypothetical protein AOA14_10720 [Sphingopyxis terrae subsp. terrae NBRC 15098]|uniref:DUF1828 domain-containing protein n=1 Tax=Sphingopyxis terrae subsp. terrae NBRC 15098 TaxID=1219058 RepID=A0A142W0L4_9SPHN|nr:hypothetical protein [Sphingopyxis terrae]AMU95077.1 hypothetical protein AOA14_10720 [Sphingopyxis terrae subsp. terrae NBRC 15098]
MSMAFEQISADDIRDAGIRKAVSSLVRASSWGNAYLISVPLVYPSGTTVGVKVTPHQGAYIVSDFGLGWREAEGYEAQRSFGAHAGRIKDEVGVEYNASHEFQMRATERQLTSAIRRVAYASHRAAVKAFHSLPEACEQEIGAALFQRLRETFGNEKVAGELKLAGASNIEWPFAAQVVQGKRRVVFDVISPQWTSVVAAKSKFSDVRHLGPNTIPIAVVDSLDAMGKWLPLISQEAEVIEDDASADELRRVVAEAA